MCMKAVSSSEMAESVWTESEMTWFASFNSEVLTVSVLDTTLNGERVFLNRGETVCRVFSTFFFLIDSIDHLLDGCEQLRR